MADVVALVGPPGGGMGALASAVARARSDVTVVDHAFLDAAMKASATAVARSARASVEAGLLVPDRTLGALLAELAAATPGPVLFVRHPRNRAQLAQLRGALDRPLAVVHLDSSRQALDLRLSRGCKRPEEGSPDATGRIEAELQPLLAEAASLGLLHTVEAGDRLDELVVRIDELFGRAR